MHASKLALAAGLAALAAAGAAVAAPCYIVVDRNDTVVYRDVTPPFDLTDPRKPASPERAEMRRRGLHLIVADFEKCNAVGYISPTTGATTATVDEIVMRLPSAIPTSSGGRSGYVAAP